MLLLIYSFLRGMLTYMSDSNSPLSDDTIDNMILEDDASATTSIPYPEHDGLVMPEDTVNSNTDGQPAGTPGHGGIDEGTE
ncbi:hypothetical protein HYS00_01150 [Candidatus Microgenomates bacterium]|nr:hypothetical protein [Candidatus Microgenomates bacterium]